MPQCRAIIRVTGRVQGVWYRQSTKLTADQNGISGWVRNNPDGSVSAIFEGEKTTVQLMLDWCRQGPELAYVENLEIEWTDATGEFSRFSVLR